MKKPMLGSRSKKMPCRKLENNPSVPIALEEKTATQRTHAASVKHPFVKNMSRPLSSCAEDVQIQFVQEFSLNLQ